VVVEAIRKFPQFEGVAGEPRFPIPPPIGRVYGYLGF